MSTRDNSSFYDRRMDRLGHKRVIAVFIIFFAIFPKITNKILLFYQYRYQNFLVVCKRKEKKNGRSSTATQNKNFAPKTKMDKQRLFCG